MKSIKYYLINEAQLEDKMLRKIMYNLSLPTKIPVNLDVKLPDDIKIDTNYIIKYSCGHIIESIICGILDTKYNEEDVSYGEYSFTHNKLKLSGEGINKHCDCYFKNNNTKEITNVEIKAFTKTTNVKPNEQQWGADYFLLVEYKEPKNNEIEIVNYYIADPKNIEHKTKITSELLQGAYKHKKGSFNDNIINNIVKDAKMLIDKNGKGNKKVINIDDYCSAEDYGNLMMLANKSKYKDLIYALKNKHKLNYMEIKQYI